MTTLTELLSADGLSLSALASLLVAALLSAVLGLERESKGKAAGLRTHLLVGLGAALAAQLSVRAAGFGAPDSSDAGRIAAQVVSGIGFIGAGVILQSRGSVRGLTTAATLWVAAMIGMAAGMEAYLQAVLVTVIAAVSLRGLARLDDYFGERPQWHLIEIIWAGRPGRLEDLLQHIDRENVSAFSLEEAFVRADETGCKLRIHSRRAQVPEIILAFGHMPEVREVRPI